jgi:beta-glucosidase
VVPDVDDAADPDAVRLDPAEAVAGMTLAEKASLCSGHDFWTTVPLERHGVGGMLLTDGPHGVRLQRGGTDRPDIDDAVPTTCFPTASALAASWDLDLLAEVGRALAEECLELGVDVLLGPGVNLKRSPLSGRNFEYFSEDPLLAGELATAFVTGVQSRGVGTSLKHFAGNDQETLRMVVDAVYDERTLRELELTAFEIPVRRARPWTVMCAYNRLGGTHACEHRWLLTEVLREEWGHTGVVVTDWGAMTDRVAALRAGCELEMPGTDGASDAALVEAVRGGRLDEAVLDAAATRLVAIAGWAEAARRPGAVFDRDAHHALARRAAAASVVLCRNEDGALPVRAGESVAVLGTMAVEPRFQGSGSSRVNPTRLDTLHGELGGLLGAERVTFAPGYRHPEQVDDRLVAEAVDAARAAEVAVVAVGLPDGYESEGLDRPHLRLPPTHDALVAAVAAAHDRVVVVLANGAPVQMPWVDDVAAVVEGYLAGQAGGGGIADVLTGAVNPSGRLAETFPRHLDDLPTARQFPGGPNTAPHAEGLYVGYRFHETVGGDVLFPFGHGLSYTTFAYGEVALDRDEVDPTDLAAGGSVTVAVEVTNTGAVAGSEVVQVYVRDPESCVYRPDRELRGFAKVHLEPGERTRVEVALPERAFAFWDVHSSCWLVEPGAYEVLVARSSRDDRGRASLRVTGEPLPRRDEPRVYRDPPRHLDVDAASFAELLGRTLPPDPGFPRPWTRDTPLGATADHPVGRALLWVVTRGARRSFGAGELDDAMIAAMVRDMPLRSMLMGGLRSEQLDAVVDLVNDRWVAGGGRLLRSALASLRAR